MNKEAKELMVRPRSVRRGIIAAVVVMMILGALSVYLLKEKPRNYLIRHIDNSTSTVYGSLKVTREYLQLIIPKSNVVQPDTTVNPPNYKQVTMPKRIIRINKSDVRYYTWEVTR